MIKHTEQLNIIIARFMEVSTLQVAAKKDFHDKFFMANCKNFKEVLKATHTFKELYELAKVLKVKGRSKYTNKNELANILTYVIPSRLGFNWMREETDKEELQQIEQEFKSFYKQKLQMNIVAADTEKSGTNETMLMLELKEDLTLEKGNYKRPRVFKGATDNIEKVVLFKKVNDHFIYKIVKASEVIDKLQNDLGSKIIRDGKIRTDLKASAITNMLGQMI